jgi:TP901 family phage tail tape measure protein
VTELSSAKITVASEFNDKGLKQAVAGLKKFADESKTGMERFQKSMENAGKVMGDVGKKMTRSVTLPLVGIAVGAVKTAMDFETSMTKIESLVGFSADAVAEMNKQVLEMAGRTATAPKELADALFFATSAGLDAKNSLEAVEQAAMASAIGLGETQTIVDLTTSAMNAYGVENLNAADATNALTMAVRLGKLEPAQLAGAMSQVLPIASSMGIEFHEVGAAFAAMSRTGTNASAAATGFKGILAGLLKPTSEASTALASMGLSTEDVHNSLRDDGLLATLQMLKDGLGGNTTALSSVFGSVEALSAVMNLLGEGVELTTDTFGQMKEGADVLGAGFATAAETAEFQFKQAMTDIQVALVTLGNILLPIATDIVNAFSAVVSKFSELGEGTQKVIVIVGAFLAVIGPGLLVAASFANALGALSKAMIAIRGSARAATFAMYALRAAMIAVPLLAIAAGVAALVSHLNKGKREAEDFAAGVASIAEQMKGGQSATEVATNTLKDFIDQSPRLQEAIRNSSFSFSEFVDASTNDAARFQEMTDELVNNYGETFVGTIAYHNGQLATSVTETMDGFRTDLAMLGEGLEAGANSAQFWAAESQRSTLGVGASFDELGLLVEASMHDVSQAISNEALASESAMRSLGDIGKMTADILQDEFKGVEDAAKELADSVDSSARSAASSFMRLSDDGKKDIDTFIEETLNGAARLSVFQDNIATIMGGTSAEFATHLMAMGVEAEDLVAALADPSKKDQLDRAFGAYTVAAEVGGKAMSDEFAKVDPAFSKTLRGLQGLTKTEMDALTQVAADKAMEVGTALMQGQVEGIEANSAAVQTAIRKAVNDAIAAAVSEAGISSPSRRMADEVGQPMAEGVALGIEESAGEIDAAMRRTIQEALLNAAKELDTEIRNISERAGGSFLRDVVPKQDDIMAIEQIVDKVTGEIKVMGREATADGDAFVANLIAASQRLSGFQDNVLTISEQTSGEFGLYLLEMGVDAEHLVSDLADPDKLAVLKAAYAAWSESTEVAARNMSEEFGKVDPAFAEILVNLNITLEEEMKPVIDSAKRSGGAAGKGLADSMADGIAAGIPAVLARLAELNALAAALPSVVPPTIEFESGLYGPMMPVGFRDGGLVPGPPSMPVPIMAHGGEYVLSADVVDAIRSGGPSRGLDAGATPSGGPSVIIENYTSVERSDDEMLIGMLEFAVRGGRL